MNLIDLPNELLDLIIHSFKNFTDVDLPYFQLQNTADSIRYQDLIALSRSCKRLYKITTPLIYQNICVTTHEAISKLQRTIYARPELAQYPQTINIDYLDHESNDIKIEFLTNLPNVHHLFVYRPECDYHSSEEDEWGSVLNKAAEAPLTGVAAPLSALQSCSLHFINHNSDYWGIWEAWEIFIHPTLKRITLTYTTTYQATVENYIRDPARPQLHSTMLQELHLIESDVTPDFLEFILQCPKSLKALSITTNEFSPLIEHCPAFSISTEGYINCMREVAFTLEYFRFQENYSRFQGAAIGLASFSALRVLDIDINLLFGYDQDYIVEALFAKVIPPNLELLKLSQVYGELDHRFLLEFAKNRSTFAPKLRMIILPQTSKDGLDWEACYRAFRDNGVEIEFEGHNDNGEILYDPSHHGDPLLLLWRNSVW